MSVNDLICRATTCYPNNYQWVTYCRSLHLHLWSIQLPLQAKWRAQWLWNVIGGGWPCVETGSLLPSSIKSLGFWVYMQQTASTLSVNIWEKEKVCLVWGCLRFSFLWLWRCPQFPVSVCQSGGRSDSRLLLLGYQRGQSIAMATKLKALCLSHPHHFSPRTYCEIWSLEPPLGSTRPHFPPHVCLWHVHILNSCFIVIAPVIILISG